MNAAREGFRLFALGASESFARKVAEGAGTVPAPLEDRAFEDGEHKCRPLVSVRGDDVFVLANLFGGSGATANDRLCRLLFFLAALRDSGAARITALIPYMIYARKDRRTKSRDPVTSRYVAQLLEAVGLDGVIALDVHNPAAFENAFRQPVVHLEARTLLARGIAAHLAHRPLTVMSPDLGGAKRAEAFREDMHLATGVEPAFAVAEKQRSAGVVAGDLLAGEFSGRDVVIVDDLVSSGGTLARAAAAAREAGASGVHVAVTHGIFSQGAAETLAGGAFDSMTITDSIDPPRIDAARLPGLRVVSVAPLFSAAVRGIHEGTSIETLLQSLSLPSSSRLDE